jgi:UDP-N-acetylglucosamine enolpyruvyl transferase
LLDSPRAAARKVNRIYHLDRGYENIDAKLRKARRAN